MLSILSNPDFHIAAGTTLGWLAGYGLCWLRTVRGADVAITELEAEVQRLRVERDAAELLYRELKATSQPRDPATGRLVKKVAHG